MRRAIGAAVALLLAVGAPFSTTASAQETEPIWADYYGQQIDLAVSLEGAQACLVSADLGNHCFDTEAEVDALLDAGSVLDEACSSTLRLYAGTSFATPMVAYNTQGSILSVGAFANLTSSYRVGACDSTLYNGGSAYPGNTTAGASAASMLGGWDNTIDSYFIA